METVRTKLNSCPSHFRTFKGELGTLFLAEFLRVSLASAKEILFAVRTHFKSGGKKLVLSTF